MQRLAAVMRAARGLVINGDAVLPPRLSLAQLSVPQTKSRDPLWFFGLAWPERHDLLDHLAEAGQLKGALVAIDATETQVNIAAKIIEHGALSIAAQRQLADGGKGGRKLLTHGAADELFVKKTIESL